MTEAYQGKHCLPWLVGKRLLLTLRVLSPKRFLKRTSYLQLLKSETVFSPRECLNSKSSIAKRLKFVKKGGKGEFLHQLKPVVSFA